MIQSAELLSRSGVRTLILCFLSLSGFAVSGQGTRVMNHDDFLTWKKIESSEISSDGRFVQYQIMPGEGNSEVRLYDQVTGVTKQIDRAKKSVFDPEGKFLLAMVSPGRDSLRHWERQKVEKKKWPGDTLYIRNLLSGEELKIANVSGFTIPKEAGDWLAYELKPKAIAADSSKFHKKADKDFYHLIIRQLSTGWEDTIKYISGYQWAEKKNTALIFQGDVDSLQTATVIVWENRISRELLQEKGKYKSGAISISGDQISFLGHQDTTKAQIVPWKLYYAKAPFSQLQVLCEPDQSALPNINSNSAPQFSNNGKYLFYGRTTNPLIRDTSLLEDEYVDVEIWGSSDPVLYTVQNKKLDDEKKAGYTYVYNFEKNKHYKVSQRLKDFLFYSENRDSRYVLNLDVAPFQLLSTWENDIPVNAEWFDLETGTSKSFIKHELTSVEISPTGKFIYGFQAIDSTWWVYHIPTEKKIKLDKIPGVKFYYEENDVPSQPGEYGIAGWTKDDHSMIIYDRYDIWKWEPLQSTKPIKITSGKEVKHIYRILDLDPDHDALDATEWLVKVTNDKTKDQSLIWIDQNSSIRNEPQFSNHHFTRPRKSKAGNTILFQKENFQTFPNLSITNDKFQSSTIISDVNPEQSDYSWGSIELYQWMDWDSVLRTGMLVKPAGFDTLRSYPTIINFYEKSSDELHSYPHPAPGRSTINYALYASRGYVIFNPDITYTIGSPGESAYKAVVSGATSLFKKRIADPNHTGLQGHSWGGYQVAYIVARTNIFTCAEAGAPVVNMTSAYGGIRWEGGRSRMFQYERGQSRLGKTIWESRNLYLDNSPLFNMNKVETPLLILHNDEDGAVPFEQGIEYYMALRRLGKPAWLLNYRGEPHWPVKWQNRKDFQKRMSQFFDHYLKGEPMPHWMKQGVPAIERTIKDGLQID